MVKKGLLKALPIVFLGGICIAAIGQTSVPTSGTYPAEPYNGLQVVYRLSGAVIKSQQENQDWTRTLSWEGTLTTGHLRLSGEARRFGGWTPPTVSANLLVVVEVDGQRKEVKEELLRDSTKSFDVSVPIPANAQKGSVRLELVGIYNVGTRDVKLIGSFKAGVETGQPIPPEKKKEKETIAKPEVAAEEGGDEICLSGVQIRAGIAGRDAKLVGDPLTLNKKSVISKVTNEGDGFWIEGGGNIYKFKSTDNPVGTVLPAGTYKAFPNLKPNQQTASVTVCFRSWGEIKPPAETTGNEICLSGVQIRAGIAGRDAKLVGDPLTLSKKSVISKVTNEGDGFWIEGGGNIYKFMSTDNPVGTVLPAGTYKAFPNLKPNQQTASVTVCFRLTEGIKQPAEISGKELCVSGLQARPGLLEKDLAGDQVTLARNSVISKVTNEGDGFWIEGGGKIYKFKSTDNPVGTVIPAGTYKAFPNLKPNQSMAAVTVCFKVPGEP